MSGNSSWILRLDDNNVVIEWIEPWMEAAEDAGTWSAMTGPVRAVVSAWLLNVYSLRGGAITFLWYAPTWVLDEAAEALRTLGEETLRSHWVHATAGVDWGNADDKDSLAFCDEDAGGMLDHEVVTTSFGDRLIHWIRSHATTLPPPPGRDVYTGGDDAVDEPVPTSHPRRSDAGTPGERAGRPPAVREQQTIGRSLAGTPEGLVVAGVRGPAELSLFVDRLVVVSGKPKLSERVLAPLPRNDVGDIVTDVRLSPEGTRLVAVTQRGEILAFDLNEPGLDRTPIHGLPVARTTLLCVSAEGCLVSQDEGTHLFHVRWSDGEICPLSTPSVREPVLAMEDGYILTSGRTTCRVRLPDPPCWTVDRDFDCLLGSAGTGVIALKEQDLIVIQAETGAHRPLCDPDASAPNTPRQTAMSADGRYVAVAGSRALGVWDVTTGATRQFPVKQPLYGLVFHGSTLYAVSNRYRFLAVDLADPSPEKLRSVTVKGVDYGAWGMTW